MWFTFMSKNLCGSLCLCAHVLYHGHAHKPTQVWIYWNYNYHSMLCLHACSQQWRIQDFSKGGSSKKNAREARAKF